MTSSHAAPNWTRRKFLQNAPLSAAALAMCADTRLLFAQGSAPEVTTALGRVRGLSAQDIRVFRGIPFAQPPVGPLRFRAPQLAAAWSGVRDATRFAPSAIQANRERTDEDCLYLNVFAPETAKPLPVFVWIHGGGFTGGSPVDTDGKVYAREGIVVVTVPYRLGVFGFLDWSPMLGPDYADSANNALRDLILALRWVRDNIGAFGGDPSRVTIGGESAGAKLIALLMANDEAKPLFQSAISESGGGERLLTVDQAHAVSSAFLQQVGAGGRDALLSTSSTTLLKAQQRMIEAWPANFPLRAEGGGALLPHRALPAIAAGSVRGKRLLIGTCRDESALFLGEHAAEPLTQKRVGNLTLEQFNTVFTKYRALYPQMSPAALNVRALTAEEYWVPSVRVAQAFAKGGGGGTWFYRLDEPAATGAYKGESFHSYDLDYVWDHLKPGEPPAAQHLGTQVRQAWVSFMQGGAPAAQGLPAWPQWDAQKRATMLLDATSRVEQQPFEAELRLWGGFRFE